jgi:hypothetical protein
MVFHEPICMMSAVEKRKGCRQRTKKSEKPKNRLVRLRERSSGFQKYFGIQRTEEYRTEQKAEHRSLFSVLCSSIFQLSYSYFAFALI